MVPKIWGQRQLIAQLTRREVETRYRGSLLGFLWSFLTPLLMLCVYTFVFGVIFKTRWVTEGQTTAQFALILFCGLTAFNIFAETIVRSPALLLNNPNYIKKVVFPLEVLPLTLLGSALINAAIALILLVVVNATINGHLPWTIVLAPIVLLPIILFSLGLSWFLSSLGVFLRDIAQVVPIAVSALMFLSPIFYPVTAIPERFRPLYYLNPLTYVVENLQKVVMVGQTPSWTAVIIGTGFGALSAVFGFVWFQKTRKGFADVI